MILYCERCGKYTVRDVVWEEPNSASAMCVECRLNGEYVTRQDVQEFRDRSFGFDLDTYYEFLNDGLKYEEAA